VSKYELPDAVSLFSKYTSITNDLWTVYVIATFAAAGFGMSGKNDEFNLAGTIAVTLGFWAFTLGHLHLLRQALVVSKTLANDIHSALATDKGGVDTHFKASIGVLAKATSGTGTSIAIHLIIDVCVTIALWAKDPALKLAQRASG
jgi:hypothetical protein